MYVYIYIYKNKDKDEIIQIMNQLMAKEAYIRNRLFDVQ